MTIGSEHIHTRVFPEVFFKSDLGYETTQKIELLKKAQIEQEYIMYNQTHTPYPTLTRYSPYDVVRNYNVRNTNIPDSNISIQNFQDATLGKKISKKFDRDFRTLLSSPQAIKRWRVPQESDLLGNDLQKFPSFAHFLAFGKEHNKSKINVKSLLPSSKVGNVNVNSTKPNLKAHKIYLIFKR